MLLEKIKEHYGKDLPGKSAFRNDPEAPCLVADISAEFGTWDNFVVQYHKALNEKASKEAKVPTKPNAGQAGNKANDSKE